MTHAPAAPDPRSLLERARAGDSSAAGPLFEAFSRRLHAIARAHLGRRLRGKAGPDDVVQETFLEAHRQFPHFRGRTEAELFAWLRRILVGRVATVFRRYLGTRGRDVHLERHLLVDAGNASGAVDDRLPAAVGSPGQWAVRREQAALLADALDRLPRDYREVILLRHLEQLPFAAVAARMNRSEDAVQKLRNRALATLRRSLRDVA